MLVWRSQMLVRWPWSTSGLPNSAWVAGGWVMRHRGSSLVVVRWIAVPEGGLLDVAEQLDVGAVAPKIWQCWGCRPHVVQTTGCPWCWSLVSLWHNFVEGWLLHLRWSFLCCSSHSFTASSLRKWWEVACFWRSGVLSLAMIVLRSRVGLAMWWVWVWLCVRFVVWFLPGFFLINRAPCS
jgi:hypothetical protein